jgi:type II secretory pathway pseudopilin PulG
MSTGLIIAIVVAAIIILALLVMLPRMRAATRRKQAERELHSRRQAVATEHREEASERETRAERAERQARIAQQEAERERAEANMRKERATMHERGMADDELIDESERDRFAEVSGPDRTADADETDDRPRAATDRDADDRAATDRDERTAPSMQDGDGSVSPDYQRGREDERRFERSGQTDDERESERQER